MRWRSRLAMRIRAIVAIASAVVILPLFWAREVPVWVPAALILLWIGVLLTEVCPNCRAPLAFRRFNPLARRPVCPVCNEEID